MEYFVSLGSDCSVALYLRDKGLRTIAFPFDWCVTSMESVLQMIENDFEDFLLETNLVFLQPATRKMVNDEKDTILEDWITPCYCKKYHMLIPHDFSARGKEDLSQVKDKYQKRIARMIELLKDPDNSFVFIANDAPTATTSWRAQQFEKASGKPFVNNNSDWKNWLTIVISNKYPHLKYKMYDLKEFKKL